MDNHHQPKQRIAIIGGGLVGLLAALYAANHFKDGEICIFEKRPDPRRSPASSQSRQSINLAISHRGLWALHKVHLREQVLQKAIPIRGRMQHRGNQSKEHLYGRGPGELIYSIDRQALWLTLLDAVAQGNIECLFERELLEVVEGTLFFSGWLPFKADIVFACDGVRSRVRQLCKSLLLIDAESKWLYKEVSQKDPLTNLSPHHLHVWAVGNESMLMALPKDLDGSFTFTFFASENEMKSTVELPLGIQNDDTLKAHSIKAACIDSILVKRPDQLIIFAGDAAHAMLPFYGQGVNAGFEDIRLIFENLENGLLDEFAGERALDGLAIAKMAEANFYRMRNHTLKAALEDFWDRLGLIPDEYRMVAFTDTPYRLINRQRLSKMAVIGFAILVLGFLPLTLRFIGNQQWPIWH